MTHWATHAIESLKKGDTVQIRPRGHSMKGKVEDGNLVTLAPYTDTVPVAGDIVLVKVKVKGRVYLHLFYSAVGERLQIGNNRGHINGWVGANSIYGQAIRVEP